MKNKKYTKLLLNVALMVVIVLVSIILKNGRSTTIADLFSMICIYIVAAISLNLVCGNLGELVLGHGAFLLVGYCITYVVVTKFHGYLVNTIGKSETSSLIFTTAGSTLHLGGYGLIIAVTIISAVVAGICGLIVGLIVLGRMKGDYLAIVTLGIGLIAVCIVQNIDNFKNVISITTKVSGNPFLFAVFAIVIVFICVLFITSRFGRCTIAIREDAIAAEASGIPVTKYKILVFTFSAMIAGIAGSLLCFYLPQEARSFNQDMSIELMLMIVLGGLGSYTGTIIAVPLLLIFNNYVLVELASVISINPKIAYGIILVVIMLFRKEGIMGTKEFNWAWFLNLFKKKKKKKIVEDSHE